jgi:Overcoming lysogenization defect protein-like, TOPRIM domain
VTTILVEGESDRLALEALARRLGRDLEAEDVSILAIGGAHGVGREVRRLHPRVRIAGLCDEGEERHFRRAFEAVGRAGGVFVCHRDLEDESARSVSRRSRRSSRPGTSSACSAASSNSPRGEAASRRSSSAGFWVHTAAERFKLAPCS